ncbi:hypothetical protein DFJ63DRAFT_283445 [Scheffersomyces coipomensis]|uniref:uncharacterized protein n=1 Tax=Scheffersomyces coipomensis TaxID=1788519 RepID=UPI00315D92F3
MLANSRPDSDESSAASHKKELTLNKYREFPDELEDGKGFEEDFNLSFSRFSHISGSSVIVRSTGSKSDQSVIESPFVKRIQGKLNGIIFEDSIGEELNNNSNNNNDNDENDKFNNNDVESPFIEKITKENIPVLSHSPIRHRKLKEVSSNRDPRFAIHGTPNKLRSASVKVSLTPAQRFEKRPGTRSNNALDNFEFSNLLGRGGCASVYKAKNLKTGQIIAIKQVFLEKDQDVAVLMREIDLLKILKHSNIVKYHGFVKTASSLNILLEYCSGGSLRQLYKKKNAGLPEKQIIKYVKQIIDGLIYLHDQGVVHRDVKAANVLLTDSGDIKLADFGIAANVNSRHDTIVGTPNWMAPETVLGGDGICTASDIWSLGATIIELFTTNPPYHDLNPMAVLHAIGTDEHPPLSKSISLLAKDFLLECFQKQPSLRTSAKLLSKHKWLTQPISKISMSNLVSAKHKPSMEIKSISMYSELNEENWDNDFGEIAKISSVKQPLDADIIQVKELSNDEEFPQKTKYTKTELLSKFTEDDEGFDVSSIDENLSLRNKIDNSEEINPFVDIDIQNFDSNELEIQSKMEYLVSKFSNKVDMLHYDDNIDIESLVKTTGRMLHIVKKYPLSHDTLIRDHGIISLLELLNCVNEIAKTEKIWYYALATLNVIFEENVSIFENFCLLGGIPAVTQFKGSAYDLPVRLQVVRFIRLFKNSDKALSMLVSCGGLRVVSKFLEEDFDVAPAFPIAAVECIHSILSKDLTRSKSDLCRILAKYGVVFWFAVFLNRLTRVNSKQRMKEVSEESLNSTIDKIMDIIKFFGQSEVRVRINIAHSDLFKLLIKIFKNVNMMHQLTILRFFKSMSFISEVLKAFQKAEFLEFIVQLLESHPAGSEHYKEYINSLAPILYNCCYLNHAREAELISLGALPYMKALSMINLPFRQFLLPIMCELVYCGESVKQQLKSLDIMSIYYNLVLDPYWQSNSLDSIITWYNQESKSISLDTKALDCFIAGFLIPKVSNLESVLDNYLKLISFSTVVANRMANREIFSNILTKIGSHSSNMVVQLSLLKILKPLVSASSGQVLDENSGSIKKVLQALVERKGSILVVELSSEIIDLI